MLQRIWTDRFLWSIHTAVVVIVAHQVDTLVPEPYMDEIFHVTQAQTYCSGRWLTWDPKLTTPPGLYLPSSAIAYCLGLSGLCSVPSLRAVNAFLVAIPLPVILADVLALLRHGSPRRLPPPKHAYRQCFREALILANFPLVWFFAFLYYTDVASLLVVLVSWRAMLKGSRKTSAILGLAALFFRQTNILWVAYIAFCALETRLRTLPESQRLRLKEKVELTQTSLGDAIESIYRFAFLAVLNPITSLRTLLPYLSVLLSFAAFVRWNGGIVLGDKTMHVAVLHIPQVYYFIAFTAFMWGPLLLLDRFAVARCLRALVGSPWRVMLTLITCAAICYTVNRFTIEHPFLLADNRHYPFYVWRKIYKLHRSVRYLATPGYMAAGALILFAIAQSGTWTLLPLLAFSVMTALTLIPSPLLEFRYFIVPYVILRLHLRPPSRMAVVLEYLLYTSINVLTMWAFLYRPFKWPGEEQWMRFMW